MTTVSFTEMKQGTQADYQLLQHLEEAQYKKTAARIIALFETLKDSFDGYPISRYEHCLQSATLAYRDGADNDWIVSALLHDIGDTLSPHNHDSFAAAILRPYVREECSWVLQHHGIFQMVYYGHHVGLDPNARDKYRDNRHYQAAVDFCERWDQCAFNPAIDNLPLSFFVPMVNEVFARDPWQAAHLQPDKQCPLYLE